MKTLRFFALATAAVAALMSCDPQGEDGYDGTNYIYLSTEGSTSIFESDKEPIVVDIMLTTALKEDLTLDFIVNDNDGIVRLEGNPVTVKAGEKTASFEIWSNNSSQLIYTTVYNVALAESCVLPENVKLDKGFSFTLNPAPDMALTDEEKAIIEAYKEKTGIDLNKYLGLVSVNAVYTASDPDTDIPHDPVTFNGKTLIVLSEDSTPEKPVLEMASNPMGIQDVLYDKLCAMTIESMYWTDPDASPNYSQLVNAIGWTTESEEIFKMSLDGIVLDGTSVEFLKDLSYTDEWGDNVTLIKVPFEFEFTAYERELKAIEDKLIGTAVDEYWFPDATVNPAFHLNCDNVSEDYYEYGNWIESAASITENELRFTFCIYNYNDYDYTKVVATYTPNE